GRSCKHEPTSRVALVARSRNAFAGRAEGAEQPEKALEKMTDSQARGSSGETGDIIYPSAVPFVLVHAACFGAISSGVGWSALLIGAALYWLRIVAIGAGYHRYFSHRSYATSRTFQFILAFLAQSSAQKSVLWWAAKHRHHHLHSD